MTSLPIRLSLWRHAHQTARRGEPVRLGVPFGRGLMRDLTLCSIVDPEGAQIAVQWRVLEHWSDGSVRWALADFRVSTPVLAESGYTLRVGERASPAVDTPRLSVAGSSDGIAVSTGTTTFSFAPGARFPFSASAIGAGGVSHAFESGLTYTDGSGRRIHCVTRRVSIEEQGQQRVTIAADGNCPGVPALRFQARIDLFAGLPVVALALTIHNTRRARHAGGIWVLGDPGSLLFKDLSFRVALASPGGVTASALSLDCGAPLSSDGDSVRLCQHSSGGEAWASPNHVNRDGRVPISRRGYSLTWDSRPATSGLRATPVAQASAGRVALTVAAPLFWQNFPKSLTVGKGSIDVGLFPSEWDDLHELQGGEQKTHSLAISFAHDGICDLPLDWARNPTLASLPATWYAQSEALTPLPVDDGTMGASAAYDRLVAQGVDGPTSFFAKAEAIDEFGWRHFGDLFADHEAQGAAGRSVVASHYNNQYDAVAGFAAQFMRTGDARWWCLMRDLASHVADIDIYHTTEDKSAFNGGLFWHTSHYVDAATSTHRSYPRLPGVAGGGPSNEHCYTDGLLLDHLMTGDPGSRAAVLGLAQWVLDIDDGSKTVFRWLAGGDTGLASSTAEAGYHGPGRGAGNAILALLNADRLAPGGSWLGKAEQLIRRCIHPADDIDARQLLDAERRWSYTVFLQVLTRYLAHKAERGAHDAMSAYAADSLLAYARWMRVHEYPYLDKPEILEYPNETWSAQDIRKAEVLYAAAELSGPDERAGFIERADFFFDHSVEALAASPTATLTRPMVLLLAQGMRARGLRGGWRFAGLQPGPGVAPPSQAFVPQRARAIRRAKLLAAALAGIGLAASATLVWWFLTRAS